MGKRNCTYMGVVRSYLGAREVLLCGIAQYVNLWGTMVGYTITATASMIALQRSDCFHKNGHGAKCEGSGSLLMIAYGMMELLLSQFPSLENITWMSVVAALMSFAYSSIGLSLCVARWASHGGGVRGSLSGAEAVSSTEKTWLVFQALGNIAFAYTYAEVLIEIQDTLKSPPAENKTMKRVTMYGIGMTSIFYISLGSVGYAAFGNGAPGNLLTGFAFFEPFWLVDVANLCLVVHLIGAYQVFAQPIYAGLEKRIAMKWPESKLVHSAYTVKMPFFRGKKTDEGDTLEDPVEVGSGHCHHTGSNAASLLQCRSGSPLGDVLLASDGILPCDHAHCTEEHPKGFIEVADAPWNECSLSPGFSSCQHRLCC